MRVEFKSKAVVHFDQQNAPPASASLADNGAVHTVANNALTLFMSSILIRFFGSSARVSNWCVADTFSAA